MAKTSTAIVSSHSNRGPSDTTRDDGEPPEPSASPARDFAPELIVESALARALGQAADAGRFDIVAQLACELEARRLTRSGSVVTLGTRRKGGPQ